MLKKKCLAAFIPNSYQIFEYKDSTMAGNKCCCCNMDLMDSEDTVLVSLRYDSIVGINDASILLTCELIPWVMLSLPEIMTVSGTG